MPDEPNRPEDRDDTEIRKDNNDLRGDNTGLRGDNSELREDNSDLRDADGSQRRDNTTLRGYNTALRKRASVRSHVVARATIGLLVCYAAVITIATVALVLQNNKDNKALSRATAALSQSASANDLAKAVQVDRTRTILQNCRTTNKRNAAIVDRVTRRYDREAGLPSDTPQAQLQRAIFGGHLNLPEPDVQSLQSSYGLITSLVDAGFPKQNCNKTVRRETHNAGPGKHPPAPPVPPVNTRG
jgi:hypothetical protein